MNKAQKLAEERYPIISDNVATIKKRERAAFIAGLQVGMEFAEWIGKRIYISKEFKDNIWWDNNKKLYITTEQLFEIFINEKHDTTIH
jgi:hypothetical protein